MAVLKTKSKSSNRLNKLKKDLIESTPLNLLIPAKLHKEFKIKTIKDSVSMTDVIVNAIIDYVEKS